MPGENEDFEKSLIEDITGHENGGDGDNQDDGDEQDLPPDPENDEQERREPEGDDDDSDVDEPDGLEEERRAREQEQQQKPQPKEKDKDVTTVVTDLYDPKLKFEDRKGDLFFNGKLIARNGRERRNFEGARKVIAGERKANVKLTGRLTELADAARTLHTRYVDLEKNKNMFEKAELSFDEQKLMFDVAVAYKKNPIEGLKLMLTKAKVAGVDIASLGVNGGGIDVGAIVNEMKTHIDERLKPVNDMTTERADQDELAKQTAGFFDRNPEAEEFAETLKGGVKALASILAKARREDIDAGIKPLKLDEYWAKLHYEVLKRGGVTKVVTKDKQQERRQKRIPRAERRKFNGDESYEAIGRSVLADIRNL